MGLIGPFWEGLKEGVGRLIRTASDRGAIVLGDPRAINKPYGRGLIDALPPARRVVAPWARIVETLREFYGLAGDGNEGTESA